MSSVVFPSLDAFLASRRIVRVDGGAYMEDGYDFGVQWRGRNRDSYRLTWLGPLGRTDESAAPGELYLLRFGAVPREGGMGHVEMLCVVPPAPGDGPAENIRAILGGWEDVCGKPNSIAWIRDRVAEALRAGWARPAAVGHV